MATGDKNGATVSSSAGGKLVLSAAYVCKDLLNRRELLFADKRVGLSIDEIILNIDSGHDNGDVFRSK